MEGEGQGERALFPMAVVQMPAPEFMTHANSAGLVLVPRTSEDGQAKPKARVFTLERIDQSPTDERLCEWMIAPTEISHRNCGTLVPIQRDKFVEAMRGKVQEANPRGLMESAFNPKTKSP